MTSLGLWAVLAMAVALNLTAQISLQRASVQVLWPLSAVLSWPLVFALSAYGTSFALTAWLAARLPLSWLAPVMAGLTLCGVIGYDAFWLRLQVPALRWWGAAVLVLGIALVSASAPGTARH